MLVRGALRLAADVPTTTTAHDLPQLARFLQRTLLARNASNSPAVRALSRAYRSAVSDYRRSYATTTRATQPTATVKKAVKATAAGKATTTKKAASKKTSAASKAKKTTKAKKAAPKKKKAVKKPAAKKRVQATPEQKEKAAIARLHAAALVAPVNPTRLTSRAIFVSDRMKGKPAAAGGSAMEYMKQLNEEWKQLTPAELEHYNHLANTRTEARKAEYDAWIKSHTPAQIQAANNARATLRRKLGPGARRSSYLYTARLIDDRKVKRPMSAYVFFCIERHSSGDFNDIKLADRARLITQEWKALSEGEKKKYEDQAVADKERFAREVAAVQA